MPPIASATSEPSDSTLDRRVGCDPIFFLPAFVINRFIGWPFKRLVTWSPIGLSSGEAGRIIEEKGPLERVAARSHLVLRERALGGQRRCRRVL